MIGIIIPTKQEAEYIDISTYKNVKILISGVGKVNATIAAMQLINNGFEQIICMGTCGAFNETPIGTIIFSRFFAEYDMDCRGLGYELGITPFEKNNEKYYIKTKFDENIFNFMTYTEELIMSGDKFITSEEQKIIIKHMFNGDYVDMESAAIAKACNKFDIEFCAIRVVSDNCNKDSGKTWLEIARESSRRLDEFIEGINENG